MAGLTPDGHGVRRVDKPAAFARPSIDLDRRGHKRRWVRVPAGELSPGDTVPGIGTVQQVSPGASEDTLIVEGPQVTERLHVTHVVLAFTRAGL